jgi:trans-aconitate 2-methyltransferase
MTWNASRYLVFGGERTRAAADLLARVPCESPKVVVDLGCGPGNSTEILCDRFPQANVIGLDTSEDMLARARTRNACMRASFVRGDVATWTPEAPVDLVFANAVLHWLPDHAELFPRFVRALAKGGVLAVQMPRNFEAPTHRILRALAEEPPWAERLQGVIPPVSVLDPASYHRMLRPFGEVDVWETSYLHALTGPDPVLAWVHGTALVPVRETLDANRYAEFEKEYGARLREAYPPEGDGTTLLPFQRVFVVVAT